MTPPRVLLTGAGGYLGGCVAERAIARGLSLLPLTSRLEDLAPASLDCDVVLHCAAASRNRPDDYQRSNVQGFARLLAALKRPTRLLYVSSRAVYAPGGRVLTEASPVGTDEPYGETKLLGEAMLRASGHAFCILRSSLLFGAGAGQAGRSFLAQAFARMRAGEPVTLYAPSPLHDALDVRDMADWLLQVIDADLFTNAVYNAAGPIRPLEDTLTAFAEAIAPGLGHQPVMLRQPAPPQPPVLDAGRLQAALPRSLSPDHESARRLLALYDTARA